MCERDVEDERKQEITKGPEDDDEKRGRGVKREGVSAEAGSKDCDSKQRGSGIVELCTLECCSPTDNCGNGDNSLAHS